MNITEANDLNALLDYVLSDHDDDPDGYERARDAAGRLADRAHKAISCGWTGVQVGEAFALLELPGCYGCPDCDDGVHYRATEDVPDPKGVLS